MAQNTLGGRSLTAIGLATPMTLAATPAAQSAEFLIEEPGVAGVLVLPNIATSYLTSLRVRGAELVSGVCPFQVFAGNAPTLPILGHAFNEATRILFNAYDSAGAPAVAPSITALRAYSEALDGISQDQAINDDINSFGRSAGGQMVVGPAAPAAIGAGASVVFQMVITKPCRLGHLMAWPFSQGVDVTAVEIQADNITNGNVGNAIWTADSFANPGFGSQVTPSTVVNVTITNNTGAPIIAACPVFLLADQMGYLEVLQRRQSMAANG